MEHPTFLVGQLAVIVVIGMHLHSLFSGEVAAALALALAPFYKSWKANLMHQFRGDQEIVRPACVETIPDIPNLPNVLTNTNKQWISFW